MKLAHPEIEWGPAKSYESFSASQHSAGIPTSIDLLKVFPSGGSAEAIVSFRENLGDKEVLELISDSAISGSDGAMLSVFFLKAREYDKRNLNNPAAKGVNVSPASITALQNHFKLSPIFINWITSPRSCPNYVTYYLNRDASGKETSLYGFYSYKSMMTGPRMAVHFHYDFATGTAVYFISQCPIFIQKRFRQTGEITELCYDSSLLLRPFSVDMFIANYFVGGGLGGFRNHSGAILQIEKVYGFMPVEGEEALDSSKELQKIHDEARLLTTTISQLVDFEYQFKYFRKMAHIIQRCMHSKSKKDRIRLRNEIASILESLEHMEYRVRGALNWLQNFQKRLDIRINLAFNLRAQEDSQTNLKIAKLTTEIAVDAQRDSSSMITIAAVTMFFLPGTFVCAVFSMVFFNDGTDASGNDIFSVSRKWWYFLAVTIPLTIAVFAVWWYWTKRRRDTKESALNLKLEVGPEKKIAKAV